MQTKFICILLSESKSRSALLMFVPSLFQTSKSSVQLVEIVKRPGQTLGLYIREGNGTDRQEGVFISRIALESPVYNSGCLRVGDEVLAVNLVDVTRMSLDDVVIIMSIPRRLLLTTRSRRGVRQPQHQPNRHEPKPPPVVILKKDCEEEALDDSNSNGDQLRMGALGRPPLPHGMQPPQERFSTLPRYRPPDMSALRHEEPLMYNTRGVPPQGPPPLPPHYGMKQGPHPGHPMGMGPPHATHPGYGRGGRLPGPGGSRGYGMSPGPEHLYQPPPPVITEQPRPRQPPHFYQYDRSYPKTLESLAERIHSFYGPPRPPGPQSLEQDIGYGGTLGRSTAGRPRLARTLSDQRLPATEREALSDYEGSSGVSAAQRYKAWQQASLAPLHQAYDSGQGATLDSYQEAMRRLSALRQRTRSVDYASDTEVLAPRPLAARPRSVSSRSNSLPRQRPGSVAGDLVLLRSSRSRGGGRQFMGPGMRLSATGRHSLAGSEDESDGAVSAPEMPSGPRHERGKRRSSASSSVALSHANPATSYTPPFNPDPHVLDSLSPIIVTVPSHDYPVQDNNPLSKSMNSIHGKTKNVRFKKQSKSLNETENCIEDSLATGQQELQAQIFQQQSDLEYHLEQKRLLKQKLKEQKKQILLEKHMQQRKAQMAAPIDDFLSEQLDQHIMQQHKLMRRQSTGATNNNRREQFDDHIWQQRMEAGQDRSPIFFGDSSDSAANMPGDSTDGSDVNVSSTTEDDAGSVHNLADKIINVSSNQEQGETFDQACLPVDEETPLILQHHTLPQSRLKHRRVKSDALGNDLSTFGASDYMSVSSYSSMAVNDLGRKSVTSGVTSAPRVVVFSPRDSPLDPSSFYPPPPFSKQSDASPIQTSSCYASLRQTSSSPHAFHPPRKHISNQEITSKSVSSDSSKILKKSGLNSLSAIQTNITVNPLADDKRAMPNNFPLNLPLDDTTPTYSGDVTNRKVDSRSPETDVPTPFGQPGFPDNEDIASPTQHSSDTVTPGSPQIDGTEDILLKGTSPVLTEKSDDLSILPTGHKQENVPKRQNSLTGVSNSNISSHLPNPLGSTLSQTASSLTKPILNSVIPSAIYAKANNILSANFLDNNRS